MKATSGYLTLTHAADYLGYAGKAKREAARKFVTRHGVPKFWRGRAWLVKPEDLDRALRGAALTGRE
jgi:hypothetical protein